MKCIGFANPNSGDQDLIKADLIIKSFEGINVSFITFNNYRFLSSTSPKKTE